MTIRLLVGGLAFAWLTCGYTTAGAQPSCTDADPAWILCEGFESGDFDPEVWQDARLTSGSATLSVQSSIVASGSYAAESRAVPVAGGSVLWASHGFGDHPLWSMGQAVEDVYLSTRLRLSDLTEGFWLMTMYSFEAWDATYPEPNNFSPYYIQIRYRRTRDPNPHQLFAIYYRRTGATPTSVTFDPNVGAPVELEVDRWYHVVARFRLNTLGGQDGVLEVWIDGTRIMAYSNINYRDSYDRYGWNHAMLTTSGGIPVAQSIYYDDVILSHEYPEPYDSGPHCGDGVREGSEACDDGNASNRDDCLNNCRIATCGDGHIHRDRDREECDDGNNRNGDACPANCRRPEAHPREEPTSLESSGCNVHYDSRSPCLVWALLLLAVLRRCKAAHGAPLA